MPTYFLDTEIDDIVTGTSGSDTISGPTGGVDQINAAGGADRINLALQVFIEHTYIDESHQFWTYYGTGQPFSGVINGGGGADILRLQFDNVFGVTERFEAVARANGAVFSLRDASVAGIERLEVYNDAELSLIQLNSFSEISGSIHGAMRLALFGAGGTFDLHAREIGLSSVTIDARALTSGFTYTGSTGDDTVLFGGFDDRFHYTGGGDTVSAGAGRDTLVIVAPGDTAFNLRVAEQGTSLANGAVFTGFERFEIVGSSASDVLDGEYAAAVSFDGLGGNDVLSGGRGVDTLLGGDGDDILHGRPVLIPVPVSFYGFDTLDGGAGNDRIYAEADVAFGGDGNDTIIASLGSNLLYGGAGRDNILSYGADQIFGGAGHDRLQYRGSGSVIHGDDGNDLFLPIVSGPSWIDGPLNWLYGDAGNDTFVAGPGMTFALHLHGGIGDDVFVLGASGQQVIELAGGGFDTVRTTVSMTLAAHVEALELIGNGNTNATGNDGANVLTGGSGSNTLTGRGGADILSGGSGADTFRFLSAGDSRAATGIDTILDFNFTEGDRINVHNVDANTQDSGNQDFNSLIDGNASFTGACQYRFVAGPGLFWVEFNTDTDAEPEFAIALASDAPPASAWLVL